MTPKRSCYDCVHVMVWHEYGHQFVDCRIDIGWEWREEMSTGELAQSDFAEKCPDYREAKKGGNGNE